MKGNTTGNFGLTEREAFKICKTLLQATSVLAYYDEHTPLVLTCDVSPYGLGAVLEGKPMSSTLSPRMIRWRLFLSSFSYTLKDRADEQLGNMDALSRLPLVEDPPHPADVLFLESEDAPYDAIEIAAATQADSSLRTVKTWIENGRVNLTDCQTLPMVGKFKPQFNELSLSCGCILWSNRVVIPQNLQQPILEELHALCPGIVAMKELASECQLCQQTRHSRPAVRSSFWTRPTYKWQWLHIDFLGLLQGRNFLIVVDAYKMEIQHVQTPPYHPASNVMAERGVQMAKNALRQMSDQNVDCELPRYPLMQRNTPRLYTGKSPAELLIGRRLRRVFDNMHPNCQACKLQQMQPFRKFHPEQRMWERRLTSDKWKLAVVLTTEGQMYLQENGVVTMRHVDQLHDRDKHGNELRGQGSEPFPWVPGGTQSKELPFDGAPSLILRCSQQAGAGTNSTYNDFV
ncbi:hypothetical protein PR048_021520 [Dryococelus australis]|uniref:Reverse transcriptase/retrotransposon-derived protein RNase H-like domain-containing protein n=1 Tax=Dryococelus australis TaxID=614101 RepID=A0ABQ9GYG8_9NEOP|nr:hypothetical protein PR048_021520 [Dryococelus australis]